MWMGVRPAELGAAEEVEVQYKTGSTRLTPFSSLQIRGGGQRTGLCWPWSSPFLKGYSISRVREEK
ncbi:rCG34565 [Rattus norvegicus]|uniref:RCG34565 n=1 Tax=Rattus norvegicus TaxID=10116 RepID=A6HES2_RAT|nr:rCG34565 [Rattus norvegicus]